VSDRTDTSATETVAAAVSQCSCASHKEIKGTALASVTLVLARCSVLRATAHLSLKPGWPLVKCTALRWAGLLSTALPTDDTSMLMSGALLPASSVPLPAPCASLSTSCKSSSSSGSVTAEQRIQQSESLGTAFVRCESAPVSSAVCTQSQLEWRYHHTANSSSSSSSSAPGQPQ
jgi:hypothetical protein